MGETQFIAATDSTPASDWETKHWDVVIIGSGAGGATVAQSLAGTGKSVLILERGDHRPKSLIIGRHALFSLIENTALKKAGAIAMAKPFTRP